jgi:hypothetical protein
MTNLSIPHEEVKEYVDMEVPVYANSDAYVVKKDGNEYYIQCLWNNHRIGLGSEGRYNATNFYTKE